MKEQGTKKFKEILVEHQEATEKDMIYDRALAQVAGEAAAWSEARGHFNLLLEQFMAIENMASNIRTASARNPESHVRLIKATRDLLPKINGAGAILAVTGEAFFSRLGETIQELVKAEKEKLSAEETAE